MSVKVSYATESAVRAFAGRMGSSSRTFRYFSKRDVVGAMRNHVVTLVGREGDDPIVYGHLDRDGDAVWLGVCVADGFLGRGHGREMVRALVAEADARGLDLRLAVDEDNPAARGLYASEGFVRTRDAGGVVYMERRARVADSIGSMIDKLATVNQKMFLNQELLYEVRRLSLEEFKEKFFSDEEGVSRLWTILKNACDMNIQRQALIAEVDEKIVEIVRAAMAGKDLDNGSFIQRQHKTY